MNRIDRSVMAQTDPLTNPFRHHFPAPQTIDIPVMIAADPYPFQRVGHLSQQRCGIGFQPRLTGIIMIIVTEAEYFFCGCLFDQLCQIIKSGMAVIRRQHLTLSRIKACLFEMQVSHKQRVLLRPVKGSRTSDLKLMTSERKGNHLPDMR
jgi:hypothetical protein